MWPEATGAGCGAWGGADKRSIWADEEAIIINPLEVYCPVIKLISKLRARWCVWKESSAGKAREGLEGWCRDSLSHCRANPLGDRQPLCVNTQLIGTVTLPHTLARRMSLRARYLTLNWIWAADKGQHDLMAEVHRADNWSSTNENQTLLNAALTWVTPRSLNVGDNIIRNIINNILKIKAWKFSKNCRESIDNLGFLSLFTVIFQFFMIERLFFFWRLQVFCYLYILTFWLKDLLFNQNNKYVFV